MRFLIVLIFSVFSQEVFSQEVFIAGFLKDSITKEVIIGGTVFSSSYNKSVQSNAFGYFTIALPKIDTIVQLIFYASNYNQSVLSVHLKSDTSILIFLSSKKSTELEEVVVTATKKSQIGVIDLSIKQLKRIPTIGGEPDIIKAFQLMPGVSGGKEGTSGLYVRGGSPDQNLFLLDDIPLYYVSHIGGFVSTFDPNAINSVKLYKGSFPARYSGRLSSVIDIRMKDGSARKKTGEVFVGLLSSKFQINGPIGKDSSWTYLLSARRFNMDVFTRLISRQATNGESAIGYTFFDLNGKLVKRFKDNSKLSFTMYDGRDKIFVNASRKMDEMNSNAYKYKSKITWGNIMGVASYSKPINKKWFSNISLATTNFKYITDVESKYSDKGSNDLTHESRLTFTSGVRDIILKSQFDYKNGKNVNLKIGSNSVFHSFVPGRIESVGISLSDTVINSTNINAFENNVFVENEMVVRTRIKMNSGVNLASFSLKDTTFYSIQPRFFIDFSLSEKINLQGGYSRMVQNMHYLSNSGAGLPSDLWIPVTKQLLPEVSNQYNIGAVFTISKFKKKTPITVTVEGFYKDLTNLIEYKEGSTVFSPVAIENKIEINGKGKVYGAELLIQKSVGKTTGWIAYTLSKNTRTFENLNAGKSFPFKYDKTHDVSLVVMHTINERIQITGTWVYSTGNAITLAQGKYTQIDLGQYYNFGDQSVDYVQNEANLYNGKNGFRMPSYHKLDLGISFTKNMKKGVRTWSFGLYNVYNHQNPFLLFYQKNKQKIITLHQITLFPIIPSFNYSYVF